MLAAHKAARWQRVRVDRMRVSRALSSLCAANAPCRAALCCRTQKQELVVHAFWKARLPSLQLPPEPALDAFIRMHKLAPSQAGPAAALEVRVPGVWCGVCAAAATRFLAPHHVLVHMRVDRTAQHARTHAHAQAVRSIRQSVDLSRLSRIALSNLEKDDGVSDYTAAQPATAGGDITIDSADAELDFEEAQDEPGEAAAAAAAVAAVCARAGMASRHKHDPALAHHLSLRLHAHHWSSHGATGTTEEDSGGATPGRSSDGGGSSSISDGDGSKAGKQRQAPASGGRSAGQQATVAAAEAAGRRTSSGGAGGGGMHHHQHPQQQQQHHHTHQQPGGVTVYSGTAGSHHQQQQQQPSSAPSSLGYVPPSVAATLAAAGDAADTGTGAGGGTDDAARRTAALLGLMWHASDLAVKPIVANRRIERLPEPVWDAALLDFAPLTLQQMLDSGQAELESFLTNVYRTIASSAHVKHKINLLCYFESLCSDTAAANVLINSSLTVLFVRLLRNGKVHGARARACVCVRLGPSLM
jgi:serine/threonine-protein kinase ULK4